MRLLLNVVQSQVAWFACVLSAAAGRAWIGVCVAAALIAAHVARADNHARHEATLVLAAAIVGAGVDTLLVQLDVLRFPGADGSAIAPLWMVALWMGFATTLRHSLAWLQPRLILAAALGSIGGPLAYYAGERLGAIRIEDASGAYVGVAAIWAIALPALLHLARRLGSERSLLRRGFA